MSDYEKSRDFILEKLDERTLLEQLAEEASELSQAALKLIRAKGLNNNNTPVGEQEAMLSLALEYMDLLMVYSMLLEKDRKFLESQKPILYYQRKIWKTISSGIGGLNGWDMRINHDRQNGKNKNHTAKGYSYCKTQRH